ncbi:ADP-ribosylglycohydrolase family protein [Thermoanaerobacterium thermosaccharolyticum]|uniref:ADP-ribosylglycohydrolase family protein n=1 Tax=Thermoanaerobacterium thermosaccharolyticum TaxID=1517 RepID=UPI00123BB5B3|nr:ADP-ribosylglycohydrolase family protein [Thermoanaerobacterium thermosaccharolyticum]KAA5807915.1 ADP-ribosylglycohydrolase family protein [Thermoanaerobacterium thermosaccharolyticum]
MQTWYLTNWERVQLELIQAKEEGKDIKDYDEKVKSIENESYENREKYSGALLDELNNLPVKDDFPFDEPNTLEEIKNNISEFPKMDICIDDEIIYDKIYGAWLGRIAGNWLGQPLESYSMTMGKNCIKAFLIEIGKWPLNEYIDFNLGDKIYKKFGLDNNLKKYSYNEGHSPEDDDINYTVLCLEIAKKYGKNFTSEDVAEAWLNNLPILHTCTAERVAYSNLCQLIMPPKSAIYRNPYREWIGAMIRGDLWGYINPGDPWRAAEYAYRDASISHTKNGIYGEMFISAMLASAYLFDNPIDVINTGLSVIPKESRLKVAIQDVINWSKIEPDWEKCLNKIYEKYGHYNTTHTINNACIVALSLIYGNKDFGKSICLAVMSGLDTDCNAATVGSIVGLMIGAKKLPVKFIQPICDTAMTGVYKYNLVKVSDLAKETLNLIKKD